MRVKSIGPVVLTGLLLALASAQGCGGESKSSKGGAGATGGGAGSGGSTAGGSSGGTGGSTGGGAGAGSKMCDTVMCEPVTVPIPGAGSIPACCPTGMEDSCGLDTTLLGALGVMFEEVCQPKDQPGTLDPDCPATENVQVDAGFSVQFEGCCRPNGQCGYMVDDVSIIPLLPPLELGLGCVDSAPFLEGGAPEVCGSGGGAGGAGGEAGASGTPGVGGAAGTPGEGGAAGEPASAGMGGI